MQRTLISAATGATWLAAGAAMLALVSAHGLSADLVPAGAGLGAAPLVGSLLCGWLVDRADAVGRQRAAACVLDALPVPAAIIDKGAATSNAPWNGLDPAPVLPPDLACGRLAIDADGRSYSASIADLPGGRKLVTLLRAGAVIPAPDLEAFARAVLGGDKGFRFDGAALAAAPSLAVFNHLLAALPSAAVATPVFTQSQPMTVQAVANSAAAEDDDVVDGLDIPLSDREFDRIRERVQRVAGIALSDAKRTLVVSRLGKLVRAQGLGSFTAYLDWLDAGGDQQAFVNALTTNLTRFFREDHHFDHLREHVGSLIKRRPRLDATGRPRLRIWSAGCSTGQEPYTIALSLLDAYPELARWDFRILATDIDSEVLARAARGVYPASELSGLSAARAALFERTADGEVRIPAQAHQLVSFKSLNLMVPRWPFRGPFDAIFCRNVAIYFDKPTQGGLFDRLGQALAPDGFLYIGHSENLTAVSNGFRLVGKTVYQLKTAPGTRSAA